jgi:hypothetical protein
MERENSAILQGLAAHISDEPSDPAVQALIARHHEAINRWFFTCPKDVYRQIGDGYVDDPRFTTFWDNIKPGLAVFVRDAIRVYAGSA